ncbi:MAG: hypothetical protein Q4D27_09000 [Coriobacteriia bacterium]|nr:hypothetical protein [Coriobacteriia bacterium]
MNCPNCNAPIELFDRFCENCGAFLEPAKPEHEESAPSSPYGTASRSGKHAAASDSSHAAIPADSPAGNAVEPEPVQVAPTIIPTETPKPVEHAHSPYAAAVAESMNGDIDPKLAESVMAAAAAVGKAYQAQAAENAAHSEAPYAQPIYAQPVSSPETYGGYESADNSAPATPFVLAIVGLVIGCAGLLTFGIGAIIAPLGIIFAIIALVMRSSYKKLNAYDKHESATLVLGICAIVTNVLAMIALTALIIFGMAMSEYDDYDDYNEPAIESITSHVDS